MHKSLFHNIKQDRAPDMLSLIVEISEGDYNKYEYDHALGVLALNRVLYGPLFYPVNYCDVPGTWNEHDNDPLDAILFSSRPIIPGALVHGRVIGALEMVDNGKIDHKIVCVNAKDPRFEYVKSIDDLTPYQKKDVTTFFELYKIPETGADSVKIGKYMNAKQAGAFITLCIKAYEKKFS